MRSGWKLSQDVSCEYWMVAELNRLRGIILFIGRKGRWSVARTRREAVSERPRSLALLVPAVIMVASVTVVGQIASVRNPVLISERPHVNKAPYKSVLEADGIGAARFGLSEAATIGTLVRSLGRPNSKGINTACGVHYSEVAWHDLIAEFRLGIFSGYRYSQGGYPLTTKGSPEDKLRSRTAVPPLATASGITIGSTLGEVKAAYSNLRRSGAVQWTAQDGLIFVTSSYAQHPQSVSTKIVEIKVDTCGNF